MYMLFGKRSVLRWLRILTQGSHVLITEWLIRPRVIILIREKVIRHRGTHRRGGGGEKLEAETGGQESGQEAKSLHPPERGENKQGLPPGSLEGAWACTAFWPPDRQGIFCCLKLPSLQQFITVAIGKEYGIFLPLPQINTYYINPENFLHPWLWQWFPDSGLYISEISENNLAIIIGLFIFIPQLIRKQSKENKPKKQKASPVTYYQFIKKGHFYRKDIYKG